MTNKIFRTRTGRNKEQTIKAYSLFLIIYRQELDMGNKPSAKKLSERLKIGKISTAELPSDIATAPYEVVTSLEYAKKWLNDILRPLRTQRKQATAAKKAAAETEPMSLGGIFEQTDEMWQELSEIIEQLINWKNKYQL